MPLLYDIYSGSLLRIIVSDKFDTINNIVQYAWSYRILFLYKYLILIKLDNDNAFGDYGNLRDEYIIVMEVRLYTL